MHTLTHKHTHLGNATHAGWAVSAQFQSEVSVREEMYPEKCKIISKDFCSHCISSSLNFEGNTGCPNASQETG